MQKDFLWVEKYRPQTVEECILPTPLKKTFQQIRDKGELPNMLFAGTAGLGKTTVAKALCTELGYEHILINASEQGNIDTLRGKIKTFASTLSLEGVSRAVILDEADYLNPTSTQPALRGFIEEFSDNCRFILTCNFKNRIIEPLHSRCGVYEFNSSRKDLTRLCADFHARALQILDKENVNVDRKDLAELIMRHAPDWRRVLNELQRSSIGGIPIGSDKLDNNFDLLFSFLKEKDFRKMRKWVVDNVDVDTSSIFRGIYDQMTDHVKTNSVPQLVLILADYQYKDAFVADHELNIVAALTEIMGSVDFN